MSINNPYTPPRAGVADVAPQSSTLQVRRLSPHQNGKVFAALTALISLVFVVPFALVASMFSPSEAPFGTGVLIALPVVYLVFGYISTVIGCAIYNFVVKFTGGIEYDADVKGG